MAQSSLAAAEAFDRLWWGETARLLAASAIDDLDVDDLDRLAVSAYLVGDEEQAIAAWAAEHQRHLTAGARAEAARCSFWAALCLMLRGQIGHAHGWLTRCRRIVGDDLDCAAVGYLLLTEVLAALDAGDASTARELAVRAGEVAVRFPDRDLVALSTLALGQALLALGDEPAGTAQLDDVMLSVSAGEVGPVATGIVYCAVLLECMQIYDLARATEWTAAFHAWCAAQPDLVPYRGQCLVHQSQIQQALGEWSDAIDMVAAACERLADPPHPALGLAWYQQGELHRLKGDLEAATGDYARAHKAGYPPMPGLALLDLARGDVDAAAAGIGRALVEAGLPYQRPALLAAAVDIALANDDRGGAIDAAQELGELAARSSSEVLAAVTDRANGAVRLAGGDAAGAMPLLRAASERWLRLRMPYEAARTSVLLGQGCRALGDRSFAGLEFAHAREMFAALGADADLRALRALDDDQRATRAGGLTAREVQVLVLVAGGRTNREIAEVLSISQHTVGRHLENIFVKLGVTGRAAATSRAHELGLL